MRTRKDPGVRQEAFIHAATELFMEKGFESVSVREVLDAVGDKTASPSVFYYYFASKDALYRACVNAVAQSYLSSIGEGFSMGGKTAEEWMTSLVHCMESYLLKERNLIMTGESTPNRLFVLDMREQVTRQISEMWAESMPSLFGVAPEDAQRLAQFLSGGISEMIYTFMLENDQNQQTVESFVETMVRFCMKTLGVAEQKKKQLLNALENSHKDNK